MSTSELVTDLFKAKTLKNLRVKPQRVDVGRSPAVDKCQRAESEPYLWQNQLVWFLGRLFVFC